MESKQPLFDLWNMCIKPSQGEGVHSAYVHSLAEIIPWMFTFDHIHYARCLSVHLHDVSNLQSVSPIT